MEPLIIPPSEDVDVPNDSLPEAVIEQLAELWCEALLANLRRHPIRPSMQQAS